jgi:hypothetical protein
VIGAVILLVSAFWFVRRRSHFAVSQERPVNVIQDEEDGNEGGHSLGLPQHYIPEPFLVPDPTTSGTSEPASPHYRPLSRSTVTADVQTPTTATTTTHKSTSFPQLRPVRIIQHDDASPSENLSSQTEPETIELPPAYTNLNILQPQRYPLAPSTSTGDPR